MSKVSAVFDTDVLVVGGGIAGLTAAIYAADNGARVLVADKADTRRSGSAATGTDHFRCYIPEVHGPDIGVIVRETLAGYAGAGQDPLLTRTFLARSFEVVRRWEEWGIPMRPHGRWEFAGHAFPGRPKASLKYDGSTQKKVLTDQARRRGVVLLNHHPATELLSVDGAVAGALCLDVRKPEPVYVLVRAKAVVLALGSSVRLYVPTQSPGSLCNEVSCPSCAGGMALGWRIGARLVNMELPMRWAGPKFLARGGKGTWIGVYTYPDGRPIGPFITKPDREYGDMTGDVWNSVFSDVMRDGRGPAYMNCAGGTPDDLAYQRWGMKSEGLTALLDYMDREGIDIGRHAVEFTQYEPTLCGRGLEIDVNGSTNVPGLYAAGDMVGNCGGGIGVAASFGSICGERAAAFAAGATAREVEDHPVVAERLAFYDGLLARPVGAAWQEVNRALQQIMTDYAGVAPQGVRSATLLNAGLKYLGDLRAATLATLRAECSHTLMRALEVLDLMELGEAILIAALERKETRGLHRRADHTYTNPLLNNQYLTLCRENGRIATAWRARWMDGRP